MEDGDWVLVRPPAEKDLWTPSLVKEDDSSKPLKVTFGGPVKFWTDAIPIGNGRLGAMVWGGVASETLQLNEDTHTLDWNSGQLHQPKCSTGAQRLGKMMVNMSKLLKQQSSCPEILLMYVTSSASIMHRHFATQ